MTQKKRPRWYDDPRVAIVISLVGFVLSVFPTWYPIISDWINSNFVGMVYAFDSIANPVLPMKTGISVGNSANRDAWKKVCISTSLYIEITNNTSHRLSIQGFEIQQESSEGKWVTLPEASLSPPYIVELSTPDLGAASYFDYSSNYFDKLIKSTTLETGVKLQGWTFLFGNCSLTAGPRFLRPPWHWWPPLVPWREATNRPKGGRVKIYDTLGGETYISIIGKKFTGANLTIMPDVIPVQKDFKPVWADATLSWQ
jgi:hypothetical protein